MKPPYLCHCHITGLFLLHRCARFLLHYQQYVDENSSHIRPQTCYTYPLGQDSQRQFSSNAKSSSAVSSRPTPTPHDCSKSVPEQTSSKPQTSSPSDRPPLLLPDVIGKQSRKGSVSDTRLASKQTPEVTTVRASVSDQHLVCKKKADVSPATPPNSKPPDHHKVPSHSNRTLRYMARHFPPQVTSRESSAMVKIYVCIIYVFLFYVFLIYFCRVCTVPKALCSVTPWWATAAVRSCQYQEHHYPVQRAWRKNQNTEHC